MAKPRGFIRTAIVPFAVATALAASGCGGDDLGSAPDVRGLSLPSAEQRLKQAGFNADVSSDGTFGVIVESNWVVCDQSTPVGKLVPLDVSRDC